VSLTILRLDRSWGLLRPLQVRDFGLLWAGMAVSLLGDGFYNVAIAWQVYQIANTPAALGAVGAAFTLPRLLMLFFGGVLSDRHDRRLLMLASNLAGCAAIGAIGALSVLGALQLWEVFVLVAAYGLSVAIFMPAYTAAIPQLLPVELLPNANALDQFVRHFTMRLIGPALAGLAISLAGSGWAFIVDAGSFGFAAVTVALMRDERLAMPARPPIAGRGVGKELLEGVRYVLGVPWLWATMFFAGTMATVFLFGPAQVLLPWVVKNRLGGNAADLGWVLAAAGAGAVLASAAMAERPLQGRFVTLMYAGWVGWALPVAIYGLATNLWLLAAASFVLGAGLSVGQIIWYTLMHTRVPARLLGRVAALDWQISLGLVPLSYALTGPVAAAIGPTATLIGGGLLGTAVMVLPLAIPGVRALEQAPAAA
jgi:MFS family permease